MIHRTITHVALTVALAFSTAAALAQDAPNVNKPPAKPADQGQAPNVNQPPNPSQEERQRERQEQRQREQAGADGRAGVDLPASFYKVSELMGLPVDANGREQIGVIRNLAINTENGRIRYVIVDRNGTLHPIPMPAVKFANNRQRATVDTTLERMKDAPVFKPDGWNTIGDANWGRTVFEFYGIQRDPDYDRDRPDFVPANAVVGARAETRQGDNLGTLKDVMVDTEKNAVAYTTLQFSGNNRLFGIPWQALNVQESGKRIVVRGIDRDDLKDAPGFANSRWPTYQDLGWNNSTNFDSRPPTWVYGYRETANGGGGNGGGGSGNGDGGDRGVMGGWQTNSKYSQLFRRNSVERITGRIVRSESVTPMSGMLPGTALIVRPDRGNNIIVHLGPEWFVRHQQDVWKEGDEIEVTGSRTDVEQKPVVMATQIRFNGRNMTLRDENGVPVWDSWHERNR